MPSDPSSVLSRPADAPDLVLRWADPASHGPDGVADLYLPAASGRTRAAPVLVALHGGFWRQEYDRRHLRPLAVALRGLGWLVVLPEYRRAGWEAVADDLRTLRRRLPGLLGELAPGRAAAGPPTLVGHSAGGQLAIWWALDAPPAERPERVVALAPVADLAAAYADDLDSGAVAALLGGAPGEVDAYGSADVAARLHAGERPGCPLVGLHGTEDRQVPVRYAERMPGADVRILPGVEHYGLIDPLSDAWPDVVAALLLPSGPATA